MVAKNTTLLEDYLASLVPLGATYQEIVSGRDPAGKRKRILYRNLMSVPGVLAGGLGGEHLALKLADKYNIGKGIGSNAFSRLLMQTAGAAVGGGLLGAGTETLGKRMFLD